MYMANNVVAHALRDVYWIVGGPCGGKTTAAQYLERKYGLRHYNADETVVGYKSIATASEQPALCRYFPDWETYFGQSPQEYSQWLKALNEDVVPMHILELAVLARQGPVVFEGIFPLQLLRQIAAHRRIVILTASDEVIAQSYFDREDKQPMLKRIQTLPEPQAIMDRILEMCINDTHALKAEADRLHLRVIEHSVGRDVATMTQAIERHFRVPQSSSTE